MVPDRHEAGKPPRHGVIWRDKKGSYRVSYKVGDPKAGTAPLQIFVFSEKDRETTWDFSPRSTILIINEQPVRTYVYKDDPSGMEISGLYGNVVLDFRSLEGPVESGREAEERDTNWKECCDIGWDGGSAKVLYISPSYVIYPDPSRTMGTDGPFASVRFSADNIGSGCRLTVTRNGIEVVKAPLESNVKYAIALKRIRAKNDVLAWHIENNQGVITHRGAIGFPVGGAVPGIVSYAVDVTEHRTNAPAKPALN
jgi:hypothetical protein